MSNALTLHDMSPGLRKVVGRESPRATLAEEPDAGNPLVRIWRGAELGNRSAYSTTAFCTGRVHPPRTMLPGHPPARAGVCPHAQRRTPCWYARPGVPRRPAPPGAAPQPRSRAAARRPGRLPADAAPAAAWREGRLMQTFKEIGVF